MSLNIKKYVYTFVLLFTLSCSSTLIGADNSSLPNTLAGKNKEKSSYTSSSTSSDSDDAGSATPDNESGFISNDSRAESPSDPLPSFTDSDSTNTSDYDITVNQDPWHNNDPEIISSYDYVIKSPHKGEASSPTNSTTSSDNDSTLNYDPWSSQSSEIIAGYDHPIESGASTDNNYKNYIFANSIPVNKYASSISSSASTATTFSSSSSSSSESSSDSSSSSVTPIKKREDTTYYYSKYFTQYFQQLINSPNTYSLERALLWKQLHDLGKNFVEDAIKYGKIIIEERLLPASAKSIQPATLGGIAGGEKYICNGIVFKLPMDKKVGPNWLYGGDKPDHEKAAEAAIQELLSSNYAGSFDPSLLTPLTAVINYGGFLVLATSTIPITAATLIYGSADAGFTVHASDSQINEKMAELGRMLNLKPHLVNGKVMALCGDIEVHQIKFDLNGDMYNFIIDPARIFPPETLWNDPTKKKNANWEKLHPKFVRNYDKPLSSDGFTRFQNNSEGPINNKEIIRATKYLYNIYIPQYTETLLNSEVINALLSATSPYHSLFFLNKPKENHQNSLIAHMHKHGIDVRHLGRIAKILENYNGPKFEEAELLKNYIYNTMISRAVKTYANRKLKKINRYTDRKEILKDIMNDITGAPVETSKLWTTIIPPLLKEEFDIEITDLPQQINKGFQLVTFCDLMGISLSAESYMAIMKKYKRKEDIRSLTKFFSEDEFDFSPTIQYSNLIDLASGMHYLNEYIQFKDSPEMSDYASNSRRISYNRLRSALATWTNLNHPILPENIGEMVKKMRTDIQEEKKRRQTPPSRRSEKYQQKSSFDKYDPVNESISGKDKEKKNLFDKFPRLRFETEKAKQSKSSSIGQWIPSIVSKNETKEVSPQASDKRRPPQLERRNLRDSLNQWRTPESSLSASSSSG